MLVGLIAVICVVAVTTLGAEVNTAFSGGRWIRTLGPRVMMALREKGISARKYRILHVKPLWIEYRYHSRSRSVRPHDISRYQHRGSLRVGDNLPETFLIACSFSSSAASR